MTQARSRRALRLAVGLAIAGLSLFVFASAHPGTAATPNDTSASCPAETANCIQVAFPCPGCSATVGPVTNLGQGQSVYVEVSGVPIGDDLELALCSLTQGDTVVAQPECASQIPGPSGTAPTASPYEYQYGRVTQNETVLSIPTEFDPDIAGGQPIVSQTSNQVFLEDNAISTFFCDNAANPCAVEVMDIPESQVQLVGADGVPPLPAYSAVGHTAIIPISFGTGGGGCGSATFIQVDASYSAAQFVPAAGEATCTGSGGVAPVATDLPSVDDPGCASGAGTHCPISDVVNGTVPVTFTDDPEDPATLAEEKQAGGKFAYIPMALSATEIAFAGAAGAGGPAIFPLSSYELTPAQAAGIMTQTWNAPVAGGNQPNDDLCGQLTGANHCTESMSTFTQNLLVETAGGKTGNLDVGQSLALKSKSLPFTTFSYPGNYDLGEGQIVGGKHIYYGDTGYALLNPWPFAQGSSAISESTLGAMWPSTGSGSTFESTGWMCGAPDLHYTVNLFSGGQASVQDIMSGPQILAGAEWGPVAAQGNQNGVSPGVVNQRVVVPASKCRTISTLPINFAGSIAGTAATYEPSSQPITAAHAVEGAIPKYSTNGGFAFTAMDSSEADFLGLLPASLQNAAGDFVSPNASSIEAALNDATANPDGTLSPNFKNTGDSGAYPMPMVTYALVSTGPQPTANQATELKDLLTNLVTYSHTGGANTADPLPAGYVPLPTNLYTQALNEISTDIVGPGATTSGGGSGGGSAAGSGGAAGGGSGASTAANSAGGVGSSAGGAHPANGGPGRGQAGTTAGGSPSTSSNAPHAGSGPLNFVGHLITVTVGNSRFFVPGLLILALLCLLAGPLLYLSPTLRKAGGTGGEVDTEASESGAGPGESGPGPPDGG